VIVVGIGGIGVNAVQGSVHAGAGHVLAVDSVQPKLDFALQLGATRGFTDLAEAGKAAAEITGTGGADATILCVLNRPVASGAFAATGRGGVLVITGLSSDANELNLQLPGTMVSISERQIRGSLYGSCNPFRDIPLLLDLYQQGQLHLDELITRKYSIEEITQGYEDLRAGHNIRGLIEFPLDPA
jgi:S-(hydroxymethyl)glutathione dehydrogenase/alcohol dehydrogenase